MPSWLLRLFRWIATFFRGDRVPYEPLAVTFPPVDVSRYRNQLDLNGEGSRNGSRNSPASDNTTFDAIEQRIVTSIETERNQSHEIYVANMREYGNRMRAQQIQILLQRASVAGAEARAKFTDTGNSGRDRLFEEQRTLKERSQELERFRIANALQRPSNRPESRTLHLGVVTFLWMTETILNGSFLARGLDFGYVQGVVYAAIIAALNVGSGLALGASSLRQLHHRRALHKVIGTIGIAIYFSLAVAINFAVAHYRDALGGPDPENAAALALKSLQARPFYLDDINSLLLLVMGIGFSIFATIDGFRMDDPYPGYGRLVADYRREQADFRGTKETEANTLAEVKDSLLRRLDRHTGDIEARRAAHHGLLQQRDGFRQLFLRHLDHLEQAGNELLTCYRSANVHARNMPPPPHFSRPWNMSRPDADILANGDQGVSPFPDIEATQVLNQLASTRRDILKSYAEAQMQYASVAEVVQGTSDHSTQASSDVVGPL